MFVGSTARQFVMIGICGGYTTFSSFSLQMLNLVNDGEWLYAGTNILLSVALCLIAVWGGSMLAVKPQRYEVDLIVQLPDAVFCSDNLAKMTRPATCRCMRRLY